MSQLDTHSSAWPCHLSAAEQLVEADIRQVVGGKALQFPAESIELKVISSISS